MRVQEAIAPNLIPMVDIMFLLLLFLMLGADMGRRQLEDVRLPQAAALTDGEPMPPEGLTIVNVYHSDATCAARSGGACAERAHWAIGVRGNDYTPASIGALLRSDGDAGARSAGLSNRRVLIRADRSACYETVQSVIEACAAAGLPRVDIGAAEEPAG